MMRSNHDILNKCAIDGETSASYSGKNIVKAMNQARIDTLQHLISLFEVNSKKIDGDGAIKIVNELINEIKK